MVTELYVWGPAFGLPSIDAECIAATVYTAWTLDPSEYRLVQSSPSAVPTHRLPALYEPRSASWIAGFDAIAHHLAMPPLPRTADETAHAAFLASHAAPLLALSLYVSSANWADTTRPAYSRILPFPLTWTEPLAVRAAMERRADHLEIPSLDADATVARSRAEEQAVAAAGWVQIPESLWKRRPGIKESLSPEQRALIRLDGLATCVLDVLRGAGMGLSDGQEGQARKQGPKALECLAFGYLALMLIPDVPRSWLRDTMRTKYPELCRSVERFRADYTGLCPTPLSSPEEATHCGLVPALGSRFFSGVLRAFPSFGEELHQWWLRRRWQNANVAGKSLDPRVLLRNDVALAIGLCLSLATLQAGYIFYRSLRPLGAAVHRFDVPRLGLRGLEAAEAFWALTSGWRHC